MSTILIVAAHPDDEILGCGGTIARRTAEGDEVHVLILAEGITSRGLEQDRQRQAPAVQILREQAQKAHALLGTSTLNFHDFPDNRMDSVDLIDVIKVVEHHISNVKPHIIYCHHSGDLNIDHRIVFQAVVTATRPIPGQTVNTVLAFEVPSSSEWNFGEIQGAFTPNHFVDITATLKTKKSAMAVYKGELRPWPHPRSLNAIEHTARTHGSAIGREAVERFQVVRNIV